MGPVDTVETGEARGLSRRKLLKRAAVGGGMLVAAPVLTSSASAQGEPNCRANPTPGVGEPPAARCSPANPCFGQTICSGDIPAGSFCTCVPGCKDQGNTEEGRCFCHEAQFCAGLTPCENASACPPGWACTLSCCSDVQCFCLPPCGTNPIFGTLGDLQAASGNTTAG